MTDMTIDTDQLAELKMVLEDEFEVLVRTFMEDSETRLETLASALGAGATEEVRSAAHSLKGSCGNLGAAALMNLCKEIEDSARAGELGGLDTCLAAAREEYARVRACLDDALAGDGSSAATA